MEESSKLGRSEINIPRIGLGTWAIGGWMWGGTNRQEAIRAIRYGIDLGITLIDTAPVYGFGLSEEIVGEAIAEHQCRDQVIIATKAGLEWDTANRVWRNSSRERILQEIDDSLRRLRTEYIDLYQIHWPDPEVPIGETAETLYQLLEQGKIRAIGVSNYTPEQMEQWQQYAPLHSNQSQLNLFQTHLLETTFAYCHEKEIGTLTWGTLAHGLLTGKFTPHSTFPEDDLRHRNPLFQGEQFIQYLNAVEELKQFAAEKGKSITQLAIRWALDQEGVTTALWGVRRPEQLKEAIGSLGWHLSPEEIGEIRQIVDKHVTDPVKPKPNPGPPARSNVRG